MPIMFHFVIYMRFKLLSSSVLSRFKSKEFLQNLMLNYTLPVHHVGVHNMRGSQPEFV